MDLILYYGWTIFILIEVASFLTLILFGITIYYLGKRRLSMIFIVLFLILTAIEVCLGVLVYKSTGKFTSYQLILIVFVLYACTFGIYDFIKIDYWLSDKISKWRSIPLVNKDEKRWIKLQDHDEAAKIYRVKSLVHLLVFMAIQALFWWMGAQSIDGIAGYIRDFSWVLNGYEHSPYPDETLYQLSVIWCLIFVVDMFYSWSYTFFPEKE
ncbi:hypothetical protein [Piscibacillus halophilus]|uniref:Integral membrane protein n=1 Tax=Piscibacillus halophilus TaxID=571933 RepID=A0A1H9KUZ9_9BACI|nr:hypothetical protein [Piscibacillus halophilus]SER02745.1 hypothetical protein SAMN05216362_1415 [Piscibacillus halophilus]